MAKPVAKPTPAKTTKPGKRRSAFVPRMLAPAALVGVIPACVVAACGGNVVVDPNTTSVASSVGAGNSTSTGFVVAAVAYPAYEAGAGGAGGSGTTTTTTSSSSSGFIVAAVAYPAYEGGTG